MAQALKRIKKELENLNKEEIEGIAAGPNDDYDLFKWDATIYGPEDSPYEGGDFRLNIEFPKDFPFKPPKIKFTTKIFHPNVCYNHCDKVCLDILYDKWDPYISISQILLAIQNLLIEPQMEFCFPNEAAKLYEENRYLFNEKAKEWTKKYAYDDEDNSEDEKNKREEELKQNKIKEIENRNKKLLEKINELEKIIVDIKKNILNNDKVESLIDNNNDKILLEKIKNMENIIIDQNESNNNYDNIILDKENKIESLKSELSKYFSKIEEYEKSISIIIISEDEKMLNSIICKDKDNFKDVENKIYKKNPNYSKTNNYFFLKDNRINVNKTLKENNIKDNDIIILKYENNK